MMNKAIVWFRNDLRLHDNEALTEALRLADVVIPIFVFDDRVFDSTTSFGFEKTGQHRTRFIIESVRDLSEQIQRLGGELIVRRGITENIIADIAADQKVSWVFCNRERTQEEVDVQDTLEKKLWTKGQEIRYSRGKMLYYTSDLPFPVTHTPDTFTSFRKEVEKLMPIREPLPTPDQLPHHELDITSEEIPSLGDFGYNVKNDSILFRGGESTALAQLHYYLWESDHIATYKKTRNEMVGWDYSSKMSPYLAQGCISPKKIYREVLRYESERVANDSTYWLRFELLWRDYFRLIGKKYGNEIFKELGTSGRENPGWSTNMEMFDMWKEGRTGVPIIDANMRELNLTGYMSNRGRQNVASFLIHDMNMHWLMGAEYFESLLVDYDPCSNYGNWNYIAGVGADPRPHRWFNVVHQAHKYDAEGEHAHLWLPELSMLENNKIHFITQMDTITLEDYGLVLGEDYPVPIVSNPKWA